MESPQELRHRPIEQDQPKVITDTSDEMNRKSKKSGTARRGIRSLALAVAFPLFLSLVDIYLFGSSTRYRNIPKPFYFPPLWALHLACLATVVLSGLSAWLVWADGGFHRQPTALILYMSQLAIGLGWYPVVFGAGALWVGLVLCAMLFGVLVGCSRIFKNMNPLAGDMVKPCLVWAVLLAVVNVRLMYK